MKSIGVALAVSGIMLVFAIFQQPAFGAAKHHSKADFSRQKIEEIRAKARNLCSSGGEQAGTGPGGANNEFVIDYKKWIVKCNRGSSGQVWIPLGSPTARK